MRRFATAVILLFAFTAVICSAQQKGQWVPGQSGLNAGVVPEPGFTYANVAINYSADALHNAAGSADPNVTGVYKFWLDENIFYFVPKKKILGGYYAPFASINLANGSLVADYGSVFGTSGGGEGIADTFFVPANFGWHLKRADLNVGYGFMAPTGRFTPGANNNVGSGYWGNHIMSGLTAYLTKNKGTTANVFMDWEIHSKKDGIDITPGQALTLEGGLGQALPLDKQMHKLLQLGLVGYDQWQVTDNKGLTADLPHYTIHSVGAQANFIVPAKGFAAFFKYYDEYSGKARPVGRTFAFGGSLTLGRKK